MYRIVVFTVFLFGVLADECLRKCGKLFDPDNMACCLKTPLVSAGTFDMKECMDMPFEQEDCKREECFAKKKGYVEPDGSINLAKLEEVLKKEFGNAEFVTNVKNVCFKDLSIYGPTEMCEILKMGRCVQTQILKFCTEWSDEGRCNGIMELFEECSKNI